MLANAINNSKKILSLPMYPNLPKDNIVTVCQEIKNFYKIN